MEQFYLKDFDSIHGFDKRVACIGYFDGLHRGHQALINKTIRIAKEKGYRSTLITFDPDPWQVLQKKDKVKHITPLKDKAMLLEEMGLDTLIILHFSSEFSQLSPQDFIDKILCPLSVSDLVVGEDFHFGFKGSGNVQLLKQEKDRFRTHVLALDQDNNEKVGTTLIIQDLLRGDIEAANRLLGRPFHVRGTVVHGAKQGRKIGFPTANIALSDEYVMPRQGIYAGFAQVRGETYPAVLNIGYNPTFNTRDTMMIESHLLDFHEDIYGETIIQNFIYRLRDEIKFASIEALIEQMKEDVKLGRKLLENYE